MVFRSPASSRLLFLIIDTLWNRLLVASEAYQHVLSKKKKIESLEDVEKLLPIDTLGVVMITHGEEFSDNSAFGML